MITLYLILSVLALSAFTYFIFYRGWRKGLTCGEKLVRQQVEHQIKMSEELRVIVAEKVDETMEKVKEVQNQIWDMEKTKDKKKKAEMKVKIAEQSAMIQSLHNELIARGRSISEQAGLGYSQFGSLQDSRFAQLLGQEFQGLWPPWPFGQQEKRK